MPSWTPLTSTTQARLQQHIQANPRANYLDLAKLLKDVQAEPVADTFLQTWLRNHRPKTPGNSGKFAWRRSDWEQLQRELGHIDEVSADDSAALPDALKVAAAEFQPEATTMVFVNPALFSEVLGRLANKEYIKLCGDGTYRLLDDGWTLLTLGVLTKHYSRDGTTYAFRTTFTPLMFAVANVERQETYECLFKAAATCAKQWCDIDLSTAARQYHADLHPGEDLARESVFPNALRVADFAHVIGACKRGSRQKADRPKDERMAAWRSGLFSVAKKHLRKKQLLPLIQNVVHLLRSLPTALLFHSVSTLLFDTLLAQEPREEKVVQRLQRFYFNKVSAQDAKRLYGLQSWRGSPDYIWEAPWWAGPQRLQPGSASGTQAQESWHRHKLKKFLGNLRTSIPVLAQQTLSQLRLRGGSLPDAPTEPFPDKWVLEDSPALTRDGRTAATQFHSCKAFTTHSDSQTQYWCLRRTLATYNADSGTWSRTPDESIPRGEGLQASVSSRLLAARTEGALNAALQELCGTENDIQKVVRVLASHVLVALGSHARAHWRRSSTQGAVDQTSVDVMCNCSACMVRVSTLTPF
eukprot:s1248_g2.t1